MNIGIEHFFVGAKYGLDEATALAYLETPSLPRFEPAQIAVLRALLLNIARGNSFAFPQSYPDGSFGAELSVADTGLVNGLLVLTASLQRAAGDCVGVGHLISSAPGKVHIALPWGRKLVAEGALQTAFSAVENILKHSDSEPLLAQLTALSQQWLARAAVGGLSPNTWRFAAAARQRGIPVAIKSNVLQLGWGVAAVRMDSSFSGQTSTIATRLARFKHETKIILNSALVPVPLGIVASRENQLDGAVEKLGWPLVVKPWNQEQANGVVANIRDRALLKKAFDSAIGLSPQGVIVERHVDGDDHRMLVVNGELLMATRRVPGGVTGDGFSSIRALAARVNEDPRRGNTKRSALIRLSLDEDAEIYLSEQGLSPSSVPETGCFVPLRRTANISTGGTAVDVTDRVHPDNRLVVERAAKAIGLDIAGVDFICPDISRSWRDVGGAVCEVNAQPGFRPHWLGAPQRDVNGEVIDKFFAGADGRIPTTAITGTNGKSTVALMLHHIWLAAGKVSGVCTTQGTWIGGDYIDSRNLSGKPGADVLLADPAVEAAVIEAPRKGLLIFGDPCDRFDVATVLNIQDDHIGDGNITSKEQMALFKSQLLKRATKAVVINADDPLCLPMGDGLRNLRRILVSVDGNAEPIRKCIDEHGTAVFVGFCEGERWIFSSEQGDEYPVMALADIPATMAGLLKFNEDNALFAVALALAHDIPRQVIAAALAKFDNSPRCNPGRFNFIAGFPFKVLLDYAHNPDGIRGLCEVVKKIPVAGKKIAVIFDLGSRVKAHIDACAEPLAETFDDFVLGGQVQRINASRDYRGGDAVANMLAYYRGRMMVAGVTPDCLSMWPEVRAGISFALDRAEPGDLLVLLTEYKDAMAIIDQRLGQQEL